MKIKFTVEGRNPVGMSRPRKGKYGNIYVPRETQDYEKVIGIYFMTAEGFRELFHKVKSIKSPFIRIDMQCYFDSERHADTNNCWSLLADSIYKTLELPKSVGDKNFYGMIHRPEIDKQNPRLVVEISVN